MRATTSLYVYDELGRLVADIDPAGETTTYTYDAAGNLLAVGRGSSSEFRVIAFTPTRGAAGETVTIYGSGFLADPAQNSVSFNGTPATVTAATTNTLVAAVPSGASSGPITVSNANGSVSTPQPFLVLVPATITAVTPSAVNRGAVVRVQVTGTQLSSARAVAFNQAGITSRIVPPVSDTELTVELGVAGTVPLGSYPFSVTTDAATTSSGSIVVDVTASLLGEVLVPTRPLSVHLPAVVAGAPAGNRMSTWPSSVSVYIPAAIPGAPGGDAMSVWPGSVSVYIPPASARGSDAVSVWPGSVSVYVPATVSGAPAGDAMSVAPAASVSMP